MYLTFIPRFDCFLFSGQCLPLWFVFSWEFPFYRCKTNKTKTKTVPLFYFFTRKLNELTEFLGSSIDASIGAAFVSFESYSGGKNKYNRKFQFFNLTSSIFYPVIFFFLFLLFFVFRIKKWPYFIYDLFSYIMLENNN